MRARTLGFIVSAVLAVSYPLRAQFLFQETLAPRVDASQEQWQISGDPLLVDGVIYYRSGPVRFFDPNVMVRTGSYRGIPIYQDRTLEPNSIVYVPIGGRTMRPYERRRVGELAGTEGSRTPAMPVSASPVADEGQLAGGPTPMVRPAYVGTTGVVMARVVSPSATSSDATVPTRIETIPPPSGPDGLYVEFNGARWYNSGPPRPFSADDFTRIGSCGGFAVYRLNGDRQNRIWVPVVDGGSLAQYAPR